MEAQVLLILALVIFNVHNTFQYTMHAFAPEIADLLVDIYSFFHNSASRREDLQEYQDRLHCPRNLPVNHVPSRWLSIGPAIDRLLEQFSVYLGYFKDINKKPQKEQPKAKHYTRIMNTLVQHTDETKAKCMFLKSVIPVFSEFLLVFQKQSPQIHILYESFLELTKALLLRFVKPEEVQSHFQTDVTSVPFEDAKSHLSETDIIVAELAEICEKLGTSKKLFYLNVLKFYKTAVSKLFRTLPFGNKLLKATAIFNPCYHGKPGSVELLEILEHLGRHAPDDRDRIIDEWKLYQLEDELPVWEKGADVATFWSKVLSATNTLGAPKYEKLSKVLKYVLVLPHGNADVERGFSVNSSVVTEDRPQLTELTISSLRFVKDYVKNCGSVTNVVISKDMITAARGAHQKYVQRIADEKEEEKKRLQQLQEDETEKLKAELEKEKLEQDAKSLKKKRKDLEEEEKLVSSDLSVGQKLLKEANEKLKKSIKDKNMEGVAVAHEMLKAAEKKSKKSSENLERVRKDRKRLSEKESRLLEKLGSSEKRKKKGVTG